MDIVGNNAQHVIVKILTFKIYLHLTKALLT